MNTAGVWSRVWGHSQGFDVQQLRSRYSQCAARRSAIARSIPGSASHEHRRWYIYANSTAHKRAHRRKESLNRRQRERRRSKVRGEDRDAEEKE